MLVVSRKVGEVIVINGEIEIILLASEFGKSKIGVSAPKNIIVDRKEIHIKRQEKCDMKLMEKPKPALTLLQNKIFKQLYANKTVLENQS